MEETQIKLVIWDLDDTLWKGSLAEGDIPKPFDEFIEIIRNLSFKGIVNSVCSNNDFDKAKALLKNLGVWEYFVFPKIGFFPKGPAIKKTLEEMHLRPENTVVIEDNYNNCRNIKFYNSKINIVEPKDTPTYLTILLNKVHSFDSTLERLFQYRLLEQKTQEQKNFNSNEDFLKQSDIFVKIIPLNTNLTERAYELIKRTYQLNFTKQRISEEELQKISENKKLITNLVQVTDNYGDYGLVGFYVLDKEKNTLLHFTFSCRIMGMGVEQFIYQYLDFPNINLVGDTAVKLKKENIVNYIKILEKNEDEIFPIEERLSGIINPNSKLNIFTSGRCNFAIISGYLGKSYHNIYSENITYDEELRMVIGHRGTEYFKQLICLPEKDKEYLKKNFISYRESFNSPFFDKKWDYAIMSFDDDVEFKISKHKEFGFNIYCYWDIDKDIYSNIIRNKIKWFNDNFYKKEDITEEQFYDNLVFIAENIPNSLKIIIISYPEQHFGKFQINTELTKNLNKILFSISQKYPDKFAILDINKLCKNESDYLNHAFHFSAESSYNVYLEILNTINKNFPNKKLPLIENTFLKNRKLCLFGNNFFELRNAYHILKFGNLCPDTIAYYDLNNKDLEKYKSEFSKKNIKEINEINKNDYYVIIANKFNYPEFKTHLLNKGFSPREDFIFFDNNIAAHAGDIYDANWDIFKYKI